MLFLSSRNNADNFEYEKDGAKRRMLQFQGSQQRYQTASS